ncbi:MAG: LPS export ABC transporter permease LptF [bacterium]|nr:LPS export ABC transporter permease LptF [bacterium]
MIIRRYISLQVLGSAAAMALVLTVILMSGRIIKYFGMAADGRMDVKLLVAVLVYRIPGFLDLIVPLGFFIAILLTFGRLYLDNEMSVLYASGVSRAQIMGHLVLPTIVVMALVAFTSLYVTPAGNAASERLFARQAESNTFDLIRPGRFQAVGKRMLYAEALSPDRKELLEVHLFEQRPVAGKETRQLLVHAASGRSDRDPATGERYLVLTNGARYEVAPGEAAYRELRFASYRIRLPEPDAPDKLSRISSYSTPKLLQESRTNVHAKAEWLWRVSLPLFVPTAMLLAFSLSRVNPRQGRYAKLLPAILLYMSYVVAVGAARNTIEKGKAGESALWAVHVAYFLLALALLGFEQMKLQLQRWQARRRVVA